MKAVFLDIDGVLNSSKSELDYDLREVPDATCLNPHPLHIKHLNHITDSTGAGIVITSDWKNSVGLFGLANIFAMLGIHGGIVGQTPTLNGSRGVEIFSYLLAQKAMAKESNLFAVESFVVLDDKPASEDFLAPFWVQAHDGLAAEDAEAAIKILRQKVDFTIGFKVGR